MEKSIENGYMIENLDSGSIVKSMISSEIQPDITEAQPTLEEIQAQILLNTEYLAIMQELSNGGI